MIIGVVKSDAMPEDVRLDKEIRTIKKNGLECRIICWNREKKNIESDGIERITLDLRSPYGPLILLYLPFWWLFIINKCLKQRFDALHIINLDSAAVLIPLSKILNIPTIYEMYDTYEEHIYLPSIVRNAIKKYDKYLMRMASAIIVVDENRIREFGEIPNNNLFVIYNGPEFQPTDCFEMITRKAGEKCTIFFAGILDENRTIETMIEVCQEIDNIQLIFAGWGKLEQKIAIESEKNPQKITFLGKIPHERVIELTRSSDILFSLYDPIIPLYRYASSNKVFEAMKCRVPIIVSAGTSMDEIVKSNGCGLVVDCHNKAEIREAIIKLRDSPGLRADMGRNGYQAYADKYNWSIMEKVLIGIYDNI